jgi:acyl-coenzyme A thioesterase PaaI-like protein
MSKEAIQDLYPDDTAHCYGCGYLNEHGYQLKTYWQDGGTVSKFTPKPFHSAIPGFVYGGLIASLIDCHATGTAAAAATLASGRELSAEQLLRYITASLKVDYLRPTPLGPELELRGKAREIGKRKVIVDVELHASGQCCAVGEVVAVRMPETMGGV